MRNANDRIDADEISKRLRDGSLKSVFHGAPEMLTLKELVRCYSNLTVALHLWKKGEGFEAKKLTMQAT